MKRYPLFMENPAARRRRAVGHTLMTLTLVAILLLCALPFHRHNHPNHIEASPFVIDAEAGLLGHLDSIHGCPPLKPVDSVDTKGQESSDAMVDSISEEHISIASLQSEAAEWLEDLIQHAPAIKVADEAALKTQTFSEDFLSPPFLADIGPCESKAQALLKHRAAPEEIFQGSIEPGQTASILLAGYLTPGQIHEMAQTCKEVFSLRRLKAGQPYALTSRNGEFEKLVYEIDSEDRLVVSRSGDVFEAATEPIKYQVALRRITGVVETSLFEAVSATGEGPELAMRIADIFGWEVDFIRDLRRGDSFKALVEKRFRKGEFAGYGRVLAAEFINQGDMFQGYLFENEEGRKAYYGADGRNLKRAFLKAPLSFTRISSNFSWSRKHPILGINRPHPAIDYAAPIGTPVMTVGDGRVVKKGWDNGGGNFVTIRHGNDYETTYMHLSRFAKGLKQGDRVNQGQVIGFVGTTGLSTGPHLDFRMKRHGKFVNPKNVENPRAVALSKEHMDAFTLVVEERRNLLDSLLAEAQDLADPAVSGDQEKL